MYAYKLREKVNQVLEMPLCVKNKQVGQSDQIVQCMKGSQGQEVWKGRPQPDR